MKKVRALFEVVLLMGIAYLIYEIMFFVYNWLVYKGITEGWSFIDIEAYKHLGNFEEVALHYAKDHPLEYTLLCWFVIAVIFLLVALPSKQSITKLFGIGWLNISHGLSSIFVGLGLVFAINGAIRYISEVTELDFVYLSSIEAYDLVYLFVIVGLVTPILEELFFRGIILSRLRLGFGMTLTVIISSLMFSLSHLNIIQSIYVFPVGILAGYLVYESGSVFAGIWLHIAYNMVNIYLAKIDFFQYNSVQLLVMTFMGLILMAFGLYQVGSTAVPSED